MADETHDTKPAQPRRWLRIRLRTILVIFAVLSVAFGWVGWELDLRRREASAIAWIEEMGGEARFNSTIGVEKNWWTNTKDSLFGGLVVEVFCASHQAAELSPLVALKNLESLYLWDTNVNDLSPLSELTNLKLISLYNSPVSDVSPLASLEKLESLDLTTTKVSDLSPLAELENLKFLSLLETLVTDEQARELGQMLPNCKIVLKPSDR